MKYGRTFLATITVLFVVLSALPEFNSTMSYAYEDKIDKNLLLEEGNSYEVLVHACMHAGSLN